MGDFFSTLQLGSFIHSASFSTVVLLLLLILGVGGLVAGWVAKGQASSFPSDLSVKEIMSAQGKLSLHITLHGFEGDKFGFFGTALLALLRKNFSSLFSSQGARVSISAIGKARSDCLEKSKGLQIWGRLSGSALEVSFSEQAADNELCEFDCFDFPLLKLQSLSPHLPGLKKEILMGAVYGCLLRGQVLERGRFVVKKIGSLAEKMETVLLGIRLTKQELYQELCVVCAW